MKLCAARIVSSCAALGLCLAGYALGARAQGPSAAPAEKQAAHLERLKAEAGVFDATLRLVTDPAAPPMVMTGTLTAKLVCAGKWLIQDYASDTFHGHGILGWDPVRKKFVSARVDDESPTLKIGEGVGSEDGRTRTMTIESTDAKGQLIRMREVNVLDGPDAQTFTLYRQGADGTETEALSIQYKRRAAR
jgi:hypothetical protein